MWELDYIESWVPKNWCFWTVVLEKILKSPLDCNEVQPVCPKIQSVLPKGDLSWIFFGKTDALAEAPILWPPDSMSWLIWKDPDVGKDWRQEEKEMPEEEIVGWHHQLDGHEFGWTPVIGDGQGDLACCDSWGHKESDMTERLNWTELMSIESVMPSNHLYRKLMVMICIPQRMGARGQKLRPQSLCRKAWITLQLSAYCPCDLSQVT